MQNKENDKSLRGFLVIVRVLEDDENKPTSFEVIMMCLLEISGVEPLD